MIREERLARMTEYVQSRKFASVEELVQILGVSKATVRRDLSVLHNAKVLTPTRGGASCNSAEQSAELEYDEKRLVNVGEKQTLGEAAAKLVQSNSSVILDAGTSTRAIAPFLRGLSNVNLVTNDIAIASDLTSCEGLNVTVTGGQLRKGFFTLRGYAAEETVRNMRADLVFLGVDSLDPRHGCYLMNADEVALKRCMIAVADRVVVVCDHTKFKSTAFLFFCPLSNIDTVITNRVVDTEPIELLQKAGIQVILV